MAEFTPAPIEGEWLWDEVTEAWIPLLKTETGHPDYEASRAANG